MQNTGAEFFDVGAAGPAMNVDLHISCQFVVPVTQNPKPQPRDALTTLLCLSVCVFVFHCGQPTTGT